MNFTEAIQAIYGDGVICYPTEGVWGLGCHPQSQIAFEKLLTIKQRPVEKGVILLAAELSQLLPYVAIDEATQQLFEQYQHDFITFVVPKTQDCPDYLSGQFDSVAVRITNYAPLRELCLQAQTALVSTSANVSGQVPVSDIACARSTFGAAVSAYVDMPLGGVNKPSRIVQWRHNELIIIRE